ncbi:hypothetical protein Dxin01_02582 [Deinococcus xinjiangensis]|uniref:Tetratricopeptide repeat protein n=1 Tax=Deinococcus xinjiangensis TaxID=457454 RepID=A0ABP9VF30_9DEIO
MDKLAQGWAAFESEDFALAEQIFCTMTETTGEEAQWGRFGLGYVTAFTGRFDEARMLFAALRTEAREVGDRGAEHRALHQVGMVERMAGRWAEAQACFAQERQLIEALGHEPLAVSINAYEVATVALHFGDWALAGQEYKKAFAFAQKTSDLVAVACGWRGLGDWYAATGQFQQAQTSWTAAGELFERTGHQKNVEEIQQRLARMGGEFR